MNYCFADYEIDLSRQELRRCGEVVAVEPQVFDLLVHLVRNRERIVSKDELIDTVWRGRIVSEAALSSRINAARRAIGDSGNDQIFIKTLHKRGFRFVGKVSDAGSVRPPSVRGESAAAPLSSPQPPARAARSPQAVAAAGTVRPAIAVLPFDNLGRDPENDYFSYGMTEDLIRLLARHRWLTVISRHSTVAYNGRDVDVRQAGEALGVRYLVVGSVRRIPELVRITAELVHAGDGRQLWAETYDLPLAEIFDVQEEMARQIAATIEPELAKAEQQLAARKAPGSLDAWDSFQRGLWHLWGFTTPGFEEAKALFRRAIAIDPDFARAHAALGYVHVQQALYDQPADRPARLTAALEHGRTSVALDDRDCFCHCVLGRALCLVRQNNEASAALETAIALNPSFAQGYFAQGFNLLWHGQPIEAETLLDRATLLSPNDSHLWSFHHVRAWVYFSLGEFAAAADFARRAARQPNATYRAMATLAASLGQLGDPAAARAAAAELLVRKPDYTAGMAQQEFFFCNEDAFVGRFVDGLRVAGVPD